LFCPSAIIVVPDIGLVVGDLIVVSKFVVLALYNCDNRAVNSLNVTLVECDICQVTSTTITDAIPSDFIEKYWNVQLHDLAEKLN
jgi:hypothetical protein